MDNIKQINTGVAELLAVKVPEGAQRYACMFTRLFFYTRGEKSRFVKLPFSCEPLGIDTELTEEQCMELVTKGWNIAFGILYKGAVRYHVTAQKAFASLMQANGINETHIILKRLS